MELYKFCLSSINLYRVEQMVGAVKKRTEPKFHILENRTEPNSSFKPNLNSSVFSILLYKI